MLNLVLSSHSVYMQGNNILYPINLCYCYLKIKKKKNIKKKENRVLLFGKIHANCQRTKSYAMYTNQLLINYDFCACMHVDTPSI
jgi:hypothetical protein